MLIKEYRIPMPLSVDEYKIAQLYMIAKKSRDESQGTGSGVEIIQNEPYEDGPGGSGQYTYKIYHVGKHLPGWLKPLLPKSALTVEEKAWNSYPYTKTRYTCPFIEKFSIEIETKYFDDCGQQTNVFNLSHSELNRQIDCIDILEESFSECNQEEHPRYYISKRTKRGPLTDNWIRDYWNDGKPKMPIMCAYKLCRVEFKYWGMQNKIEKFIDEMALRKTMVDAHRQAWIWQDEWFGMSMEDIRRLELQTQEYLKKRMADNLDENDKFDSNYTLNGTNSNYQMVDLNVINKDKENYDFLQFNLSKTKKNSISQHSNESNITGNELTEKRKSFQSNLHSPNECLDLISTWRIQTLARDSDSSDDEFYDAEDNQDDDLVKFSLIEEKRDDIFTDKMMNQVPSDLKLNKLKQEDSIALDSPSYSPIHQPTCSISCLIIVLHGGSVLDVNVNETNKCHDINTFRTTMDSIVEKHYSHLTGRIALRHVACSSICLESLFVMSRLSPYTNQPSPNSDSFTTNTFDSIPISALPLFAISSFEYYDHINNTITQCNKIYNEFIKSTEGKGFKGKICLIGDSIGSILGFDALCSGTQNSIYDSQIIAKDDYSKNNLYNPIISINDAQNSSDEISDEQQTKANSLSKSITLGNNNNNNNNVKMQPKQPYCKSLSHPGETALHSQSEASNRLCISNVVRRRSSASSDLAPLKFEFEVADFFMFGSMIGVILAYRKLLSLDDKSFTLMRPSCENIYNLFHLNDPSALRIEPLLNARFSYIPAINVARYQKYPLGDGQPIHLTEYLQIYSHYFTDDNLFSHKDLARRISEISISSNQVNSPMENLNLPNLNTITQRWWGTKRIDYALYSPEGLNNFPMHSLPHLFHSSYWESSDVISFILRQINKVDLFSFHAINSDTTKEIVFKPNQSREKWQRKRTSVKLKNVNANHRANDVIIKEGLEQIIIGRFMYGPLDFLALTGEKIDIHMLCPRTGEWSYLDTQLTDKTGRIQYSIPKEKSLPSGLYQFKMVVRGDHTFLDLFMAVVPPKTEAVVFSIDGSLTASVSVSAKDPKVRAGAIDVVRFWQERGYLIIYITGRPDMQQARVVSWLYQHNFPHGLISFVDGLSTEPLKHKAEYLKNLNQKMEIIFRAAYGSSKDISVYQSADLKPEQIYVVGKIWKKQQLTMANILSNGYVAHLDLLRRNLNGRTNYPVNTRVTLPKGAFTGIRSKPTTKSVKRIVSYPITNESTTNENIILMANQTAQSASKIPELTSSSNQK